MVRLLLAFKDKLPVIMVIFICCALWILNTRIKNIDATNKQLEKIVSIKESQLKSLNLYNNALAKELKDLSFQLEKNNEIVKEVQIERTKTDEALYSHLHEIKRNLSVDPHANRRVPQSAIEQLRSSAK